MDRIIIEDLKIFAHHGVFDFEKEKGQNFYVNAVLYFDFQKAGMLDNLEMSVNYNDVCVLMSEYISKNVFDTIEAVAENTAILILEKYNGINGVDIEIRKPEAPVDAEFKSISACVSRYRHKAIVAFGSNLGDSEKIISDALCDINENQYVNIIKTSEVIKSTPYGGVQQNDFYNGAVIIETYYTPENLLDFLHEIENKYKRVREIHWGPRTLDLDIIFYDNLIMDSERLTIPHPDMANRDFVLNPINSIAGYWRHPITNLTVAQMAENIKEKHVISNVEITPKVE